MASVRSDLELFDAFEIRIIFYVGIFLLRVKLFSDKASQDGSRIISFSEERTHLSEFHYNGIDPMTSL